METPGSAESTKRDFTEPLTLYHPTSKGTGAALRLDPSINGRGCFFLEMATQKPASETGGTRPGQARFEWENKITVKLGFTDVCEFLAVLEGKSEKAGNSDKGLFHKNGGTNTMIRFESHESGGYAVSLSRKTGGSDQPTRIWTILSPIEAIGFRHILATGLFFMFQRSPQHRGE